MEYFLNPVRPGILYFFFNLQTRQSQKRIHEPKSTPGGPLNSCKYVLDLSENPKCLKFVVFIIKYFTSIFGYDPSNKSQTMTII